MRPAWCLAGAGAIAATAVALLVRRVEVAGDSMRPTLEPGDRLVLARVGRVQPGDLLAVRDPRLPERVVVKRLAELSPKGLVVLGDNPGSSTDSRHFGPVDPRAVKGRAVYRYAPEHRRGPLIPSWPSTRPQRGYP